MVLAVQVRHFYLFQTRDFGTYRICEQIRLRRDCTSAQSRQSLHCSHVFSKEPGDDSYQTKIRHLAPLDG